MNSTSAEVVRRKYVKHLMEFGGALIHRDIAFFALQIALDDLEEVWQDEYASVQRKLEVEQEWGKAQSVALENMGRHLADKINELAQAQALCDALEGECTRLRKKNGSSSPTSAPMAQSAAGASSTSSTVEPMPSSPVESSGENGATDGPAPSAPTSRRRTQGRSTPKPVTGDGVTGEEVGDRTGLDPIDWRQALAGVVSPELLSKLESGETRWYKLEPETQSLLVLRIAATINQRLGTISQSFYQDYKPAWATSVGSWTATCPLTWRQVIDNLGVKPSSLLKSKRIKLAATN